MIDIVFWSLFALFSILLAYFLGRRTYGKDFRKWKPHIFTKDVTFRSIFIPESEKKTEKEKTSKNKGIFRP